MVNDSLITQLAESCLELAAQDRSAGGLDEFSDKDLIERRAEMEVKEYKERTDTDLPATAVQKVEDEALAMFEEQGKKF